MTTARPRAFSAALATGVLALGMSATTVPAVADTEVEAELLRLVNAERAAAGLPALVEDADLSAGAAAWSAQLATSGSLAHDTFEVAEATSWGENVGYTGAEDAAARLHELLMASPDHQANILDPSWTVAGIGVTVVDGTVWMTQRFAATAVTTTDVPVVETVLPEPAPDATAPIETTASVEPDDVGQHDVPDERPAPAAGPVEDPAGEPPVRPASAPKSAQQAAAPKQQAPAPQQAAERGGQPAVATVNPGRSGSTPAADHRRGPVAEPGSQGRAHGRP